MKTGKKTFSAGFSNGFGRGFRRSAENPALRPALLAAFSLFIGIFTGTYAIPVSSTYANAIIEVPADATSVAERTHLEEKTQPEKAEIASLAAPSSQSSSAATSVSSVSTSGATPVSGPYLSIPSLGINSPVYASSVSGRELSVPGSAVGVYGTLLMGHSSGVFANLPRASVGQQLTYNGATYTISSVQRNLPVREDRQAVGNYTMYVLTNLGPDRIVMMTCAGTYRAGFGYTERTLVFATRA